MSYLESYSEFQKIQEESIKMEDNTKKLKVQELLQLSAESKQTAIEYKTKYESVTEGDISTKEDHLLNFKFYKAQYEMLDAQARILKKSIKTDEGEEL